MAARRILAGSGGVGLLLSGLPSMMLTFAALYGSAFLISSTFYESVEKVLHGISWSFCHTCRRLRKYSNTAGDITPALCEGTRPRELLASTLIALSITLGTLAAGSIVLLLQVVRPTTPPYGHLSGTLPISLIEAVIFQPINTEYCLHHPVGDVVFPFERFTGFFYHQTSDSWSHKSETCGKYDGPSKILAGTSGTGCDPLKLSNLNSDFIDGLTSALRNEPLRIKNVLLLTLESTRKDIFPLKKRGQIYNTISSSQSSLHSKNEVDTMLGKLSETAAFLTGEPTDFDNLRPSKARAEWKDAFKDGLGAINAIGAVTQATYTLKSLLSSHCGVEPLAVDFAEETRGQIYQPCLPQILSNISASPHGAKRKRPYTPPPEEECKDERGFLTWPWESALVQTVTDQFDN
jgi:hypothetical protein